MNYYSRRAARHSIRLRGYDYSQEGAYFVTLCAYNRDSLFGDIVDGEMELNELGMMATNEWKQLGQRFVSVRLDSSVVMPNHIHGIIRLVQILTVGAGLALPGNRGAASGAPTLGDVIRTFKSISAIRINRLLSRTGQPVWQRNYYEHVIRNEKSLRAIRHYVRMNPSNWASDPENPFSGNEPKDVSIDPFVV